MGPPLLKIAVFASVATIGCLASAFAWTPGTGNESAVSGFTVDTSSRNDVISFWHCVYMESEGYENRINWTGSIGGGNPGTTAAAFQNDVLRRINFYRAMAGLDANLSLGNASATAVGSGGPAAPGGTTKYEAAQAAALMLSRNTDEFLPGGGVATGAHDPHDPPSSWSLDSSTARNGAYYSNLSVGLFGPGAIDAYMSENDQAAGGAENNDVGHRRYIFSSQIQEVATGDVTATGSNYLAANALYVYGNQLPPTNSPQFTPWPNEGFIPEPIVPERWSLTYPNADFSSATVSMTDINNQPVGVTVVSRTATFADNTIVWKPNSLDSAEFDDQVYHVTVANIGIGSSTTSFSFTTTIINPDRLEDYPTLQGSSTPPDSGARFYFQAIEHAEEYSLDVSRQATATWTEGAEDSTAAYVIDNTSNEYELRQSFTWDFNGSPFWKSGSKGFRLAFPNNSVPLEDQSFSLDRTLVPQAGATLNFSMRRGYMSPNTQLDVQTSTNGGASWTTVQTYYGNGSQTPDNNFNTYNVNLNTTNQETLVRFLFHQPIPTGVFDVTTYPSYPVGIYIDDITTTNCDWLESVSPTSYPKNSDYVELNSTTGGGALTPGSTYILRLRTRVGCHWFPFGPAIEVSPVSASTLTLYQIWNHGLYPFIGNFNEDDDGDGVSNGLEHIFGLNPNDPSDGAAPTIGTLNGNNLVFSHNIVSGTTLTAECSPNLQPGTWTPITVTINNGIATANVPLGQPACYFRWVATQE